ncbi:MAG TPA: TraB/GumN family protein [Flavihumibacter sp.]
MRLTLILALIGISHILSAQQKQANPSTLLWRISGNSVKGNSYLYGTMHLQDRRLFHFTDSLYESLRSVEGFAGELNMDDLSSIVTKMIGEESKKQDQTMLKDLLSEELKKKYRAPLEKKFRKKLEQINYSELEKAGESWAAAFRKSDDMPTIVDAFLYGLAKREGKWIGALEKPEDQIGKKSDPDKLEEKIQAALLTDAQRKQILDRFVGIYLSEDISRMQEISSQASGEYGMHKLNTRNLNMVKNIDSISAVRSCFYAVGAAHLSGDSGMIQLLRQRGFTVEPVISSKRIKPESVLNYAAKQEWKELTLYDGDFNIKMPGEAVVTSTETFNQLAIYFDAMSMSGYMSGYIPLEDRSEEELDSLSALMVKHYAKGQKVLRTSETKSNGRTARQLEAITRDGWVNLMTQAVPGGVVFNAVISTSEAGMKMNDTRSFFNSFVVNKKPHQVTARGWQTATNQDMLVSYEAPVQLKSSVSEYDSMWTKQNYVGVDARTQSYYSVILMQNRRGFYSSLDSLFFEELVNEYRTNGIHKVKSYRHGQVQGFPAVFVVLGTAVEKDSVYFQVAVINRGNRRYTALAGYLPGKEREAEAKRFINSIRLLPYVGSTNINGQPKHENISIRSPHYFERTSGQDEESLTFEMYDSTAAITAWIQKEPLHRYYYAKNDSTFYRDQIGFYIGEKDSLRRYELKQKNGQPAADALIKMDGTHNFKWVRQMASGDTLYTLSAILSEEVARSSAYEEMFNSFEIFDRKANHYTETKARRLFNDLMLPDSLIFSEAKEAINWIEIGEQDIPYLQQALLNPMIDFSYRATCAHDMLLDRLHGLNDASTLAFVKEVYPGLKERNAELQYPLLSLLARMQTNESYEAVTQLLASGLPAAGHPGLLADAMYDSLELAAKLFPVIKANREDSLLRLILPRYLLSLYEEKLIERSAVEEFRPQLHALADFYMEEQLDKSQPLPVYFQQLLELLAKLGDAESMARLDHFALHSNEDVQYNAVRFQLENKMQPQEKAVQNLANDAFYRASIYQRLDEAGKLKLFPSALKKQSALAESHLFRELWGEYGEFEISLADEITLSDGRTKNRYYLYKASFKTDNGPVEYLGVVGPYPLKGKIDPTPPQMVGVYFEELFDASKLEEQLEAFIEMQD